MILDTSAVIGLLELEADATHILAAIRDEGGPERPAVHVVTLGELAAGVHRGAELFGAGSTQAGARRRTLDAVAGAGRRAPFSTFGIDEATWRRFGEISAPLGRRVSHNDKWIIAAAIVNDRLLLTQDETLAERAGTFPGARVTLVRRQER